MTDRTLKTWRAMGPSGPMETMAYTKAKAESNLRYRLMAEYGLSRYNAREYDLSDLEEVKPCRGR